MFTNMNYWKNRQNNDIKFVVLTRTKQAFKKSLNTVLDICGNKIEISYIILLPPEVVFFSQTQYYFNIGEGQWPSGIADFSEPGGSGFESSSRQLQVVAHQH